MLGRVLDTYVFSCLDYANCEFARQCTAILRGHTGPVLSLLVQDRMLYSGSDDATIKLWDWRRYS